jgi:hypothetical protein
MTKRRQNFQPISWFLDLHKRGLLEMDPPYQRRSVWNDSYREQFIDTLLLDYPVPAVFLFGRIDEEGNSAFDVVDGKQRLMTIFDFINGALPIGEKSPIESLRGQPFTSLPHDSKIAFFEYDFPVEYLPTNNEAVIDDIFERLNKNMAKLTPQELRHAKYSGLFIRETEKLAEWMQDQLGKQFPRIAEQSRRQMKDVEVVATLLLFLEEGPKGYSILGMDAAFSSRDEQWEHGAEFVEEFQAVIIVLRDLIRHPDGQFLGQTRFRNQADFYSLFAAIAELRREKALSQDSPVIGGRLKAFLEIVENEYLRSKIGPAAEYYDAARSASNDPGPRNARIGVMKRVLKGENLAG